MTHLVDLRTLCRSTLQDAEQNKSNQGFLLGFTKRD